MALQDDGACGRAPRSEVRRERELREAQRRRALRDRHEVRGPVDPHLHDVQERGAGRRGHRDHAEAALEQRIRKAAGG